MRRGRASGSRRALGALLASLAVLLIGLAGTGLAGHWVAEAGERNQTAAADRYIAGARSAVQGEMDRYVDTVQAVAAGLSAQEDLRAGDFATVTQPLLDAGMAGAGGLGFVVPATDQEVPDTQSYWRNQGEPDLVADPDPRADDHLLVVFYRNLDGGNVVLGIDLARSPELTRTLERSRALGRLVISDSYVLLKDGALPAAVRQNAFAIVAPVTQPRPDGTAGRQRGWVVLGVRGNDLLKGTLSDTTQGQANVALTAGVVPLGGEGQRTTAVVAAQTTGPAHRAELRREVNLPVANQTWTLSTQSTDASADRDAGGSGNVLMPALCIGVSFLLAWITWILMTLRIRAVKAVDRATADLRAAQGETARQATLLQTIMDSLSDGVAAVDASGAFTLYNPEARELLGPQPDFDDPDQWSGYYGLYRPDGVTPYPPGELPLVQALNGAAVSQVEMIVRKTGDPVGTPISVSARPLVSEGGPPGAVAVLHDLTDVKEFQRQLAERAVLLEQKNLELLEANKELEAFSYTVSHDLRAPLRAVNAFSTLLLRDHTEGLGDQPVHYLNRIRENAISMNALIDDLLAFSRTLRQPLHKRPTELAEVVREAWSDVREGRLAATPEQEDDELLAGELPVVPGDSKLLKQVFVNLLSNAVKFRVPGRPVRVIVDSFVDDLTGEPVITVRDNGIGFDPGQAEKIFGVFQRLHPNSDYEGTGIGLSIVHRIVTRHGGRVWAHAEKDAGAAFSFTLGSDTTTPVAPVTAAAVSSGPAMAR